ncbi:MAG: adenylate kinase family protein, partial [Methanimicrococcus sp.]|nr:adenylate kinase family protein [Methanimicrococcus sp.]
MTVFSDPLFLAIALTGTPGTGKTAVSKKLEEEGYKILHLTDFIEEKNIPSEYDSDRDCLVVDMVALERAVYKYQDDLTHEFCKSYFEKNMTPADFYTSPANLPVLIIESHLAHYLCNYSIILRTHPHALKIRLDERGYSEKKVMENVLAESIDVVLCDCFDYCHRIYEINTTELPLSETVNCVKELVQALYEDELEKYDELAKKNEKPDSSTGMKVSAIEEDGVEIYDDSETD